MYTARHAGPRRSTPVLAMLGLAAIAVAAAGAAFTASPAHAATPTGTVSYAPLAR